MDNNEGITAVAGKQIFKGISDGDLLEVISADIKGARTKHEDLLKIKLANEKYWTGDQIDTSKLKAGESEIVVNRIFISTETISSIITQAPPPLWIQTFPKNLSGKKVRSKLERHMRDLWEYDVGMQKTMEILYRNYANSRVGFLKHFWDESTDEVNTQSIGIDKLIWDIDATTVGEAKFFAQFVKDSVFNIYHKFKDTMVGEAKKAFKEMVKEYPRSLLPYVEYWGSYRDESGERKTILVHRYKDFLLKKQFNPYFTGSGNHFKHPKLPFTAMNSMNTGKHIHDDTSLTEQARPLQDSVNKRKRQIDKNTDWAGGTTVTTADAMDKAEFDKIGPRTDKIYLKGGLNSVGDGYARVTGRSLESGVYEDMFHSIREIDNIMGSQPVTRGERTGPETLGGLQLLSQGDMGRHELTRRAYNEVAEDTYNWWLQLMRVFYKGKRPIVSTKEEVEPQKEFETQEGQGDPDQDFISREDFRKHKFKIIVKRNANRPKNPETQRADAVTLRQTGTINPFTFLEMYGIDDVKKHARYEYLWQAAPQLLFPELTGETTIEPEAIRHIKLINGKEVLPTEEIFNEEDLQIFMDHISTHQMYMRGIQVHEDLGSFDSLEMLIQIAHRDHVQVETLRLRQLLNQQRQQSGAEGQMEQSQQPQEEGRARPQQLI